MIDQIRAKLALMRFQAVHARRFKALGPRSTMVAPFRLDGDDRISIGAETFLQRGAWLYCVAVDEYPASLTIGNGCVFGYNNHITAVREVTIEDRVLTANNVFITDNVHGFEDVTTAIIDQPVRFKGTARIGYGTWIGENACIIGASVGRNCVVGANAVVTRDIPDYCVVGGIPARVLKRFDGQRWISESPVP